jgi:hypothetical protein
MMRPDPEPYELAEVLARIPRVRQSSLLVRLWYTRHAVFLGVLLPAGLVWLGAATHASAPGGVLLAAALGYVFVPAVRRWVYTRTRCVRVDRRIRATVRRGRICAPDGRLPVVWRVTPTASGVSVHVLVPIGMQPELVLRAKDRIQDATGASEVVMFREPGRRKVVIGLAFEPLGQWWEG